MHIVYIFSFEGGGALPEDTSCEGCRGQITEIRHGGTRYLGRLGGDKKNQDTFANQLFWPLQGPLFLAARMRRSMYVPQRH